MSKREVARVLRAALAAMNDEGRHWTRGTLRRKRNGEQSFCSIGAINHILGRPNTAKSGYEMGDDNRAVMYALANQIRIGRGEAPFVQINSTNDDTVQRTIWNFNDDKIRTWPSVVAAFRAAAKTPVFPKA